jgi:hypothetical protein
LTVAELYKELNYVNASREKRLYYAELVIANPDLIGPLITIMFEVNDKAACKAAWVFEYVCVEKLEAIVPYLDVFADNISKVYLDSSVRPMAKVCEYIVKAYYTQTDHEIKNHLSEVHQEKIIEACFDWLINDEKIAPKVYAMNTLYLLGNEYNWIHPELVIILERDFQTQSAGFKARAKHILKKIGKSSE